eukprot:1159547-Pelagomonas_calceolata.AAC.26
MVCMTNSCCPFNSNLDRCSIVYRATFFECQASSALSQGTFFPSPPPATCPNVYACRYVEGEPNFGGKHEASSVSRCFSMRSSHRRAREAVERATSGADPLAVEPGNYVRIVVKDVPVDKANQVQRDTAGGAILDPLQQALLPCSLHFDSVTIPLSCGTIQQPLLIGPSHSHKCALFWPAFVQAAHTSLLCFPDASTGCFCTTRADSLQALHPG